MGTTKKTITKKQVELFVFSLLKVTSFTLSRNYYYSVMNAMELWKKYYKNINNNINQERKVNKV